MVRRRAGLVVVALTLALPVLAPGPARAAGPQVHLVCQGPGVLPCPTGSYSTIQAAVNASAPGDWVLVAPGDYHEKGTDVAGVLITTPGIHLRGMDRNAVIVDGTNPGGSGPCPSDPALQDLNNGKGRNGIDVVKADGVYVENLTVCNYLSGNDGGAGNEIWWNGGDGSGVMGMGTYWGNYLNATSTYYKDQSSPMGMYGIFVSNAHGPGFVHYAYASNMGDSGFYIGACSDCNAELGHVWSENNALGFSGTNAGGHLVIEDSEWDQNISGIVPNTLNNDDAPPPQDGRCPGSTTQSCTIIRNNVVHDNNNPNVPRAGIAGAAPIGSGIELAATQFVTVTGNTVYNQGGWGIVVHDYPDTETPPPASHCQGGVPPYPAGSPAVPFCYFFGQGNEISGNTLYDNGGFGNPTNGDLADEGAFSNPRNCFHENKDPKGALTSDPPNIETVDGPPCNAPGVGDDYLLGAQLICASGLFGQCPAVPGADSYPQTTTTYVKPLPTDRLQTMPNPCDGVPDNAWCSGGQPLYSGPAPVVPEAPLAVLLPLLGVALAVAAGRRRRALTLGV